MIVRGKMKKQKRKLKERLSRKEKKREKFNITPFFLTVSEVETPQGQFLLIAPVNRTKDFIFVKESLPVSEVFKKLNKNRGFAYNGA